MKNWSTIAGNGVATLFATSGPGGGGGGGGGGIKMKVLRGGEGGGAKQGKLLYDDKMKCESTVLHSCHNTTLSTS